MKLHRSKTIPIFDALLGDRAKHIGTERQAYDMKEVTGWLDEGWRITGVAMGLDRDNFTIYLAKEKENDGNTCG